MSKNEHTLRGTASSPPKSIPIGIAVVVDKNQILVGVRQTGTHLEGTDEFPGGKQRPDESATECAVRECAEETGLMVDVAELLCQQTFDYGDRIVDLSFFLCRPVNPSDTDSIQPPFRWVSPQEIRNLNFPEANRQVIEILIDRFANAIDSDVA